jgi:dipeptidyl aminopeptidase/acylaminoacyl peptidase
LKNLFILTLFFVMACSPQQSAQNAKEIPLRDFFKNPVARTFRISPNGKFVAAMMPYKDRMNIHVKKMDQDTWERLTDVTDRDLTTLSWKGNDHILYSRDFGGDENFHVFSVNIHTKKGGDLTPFENTRASILDLLDDISDDHVMISMNKRDKRIFDVYKLNITNGKMEMVAKNPGKYTGWVLDHNGVVRMANETDGVNNTLYYRKDAKSPFKKVITTNFRESLEPLFFDFDNKNVYAISNLGRNTSAAILLNPETGKEIKEIYANKDYDISSLMYSKKLKKLTTSAYTDWKTRLHFFNDYYQDIYQTIQKELPDQEIQITSYNKDEDFFTVYAYSDRNQGKYYTYDAKAKKLNFLIDPTPWLDEKEMASMKPIFYETRDGLKIQGYLTIPKGMENTKKLPLVVNPHGGPWARDYWGYNSQVQFLANRGFAVFQMNFRGSTGFGRKFWEASFKEWGRKMQDDITDGVQYLIKEEIADKDKICIYGASYGGYATLAGLTYTPDLYKCGVDYVGVSNLLTFMNTIPPYWEPFKKMMFEMVGHPEKEIEMMKAASPFFNADKIKTPLFVVQGAKDPRVAKAESDQIVEALKKRGIDVPYLVKENEGHGFRNQENRFEFYEKMEQFISKYLK